MAVEARTVMLRIRITPTLKAQLEKLAAHDRRTMSDYIRLALEQIVEDAAKAAKADKPKRK
jgi:predicted DNA-binding protein